MPDKKGRLDEHMIKEYTISQR